MIIGAPLLSALLLAAQPAAGAPAIGAMKLHLVYQETGRLSPDILAQPDFELWNTVIGEGSAEERADDALLLVEVRTAGEQYARSPLHLAVRDAHGKLLAERRFEGFLTSDEGRAWMPLYLSDIGCAGAIEINAELAGARAQKKVDFACGE